MLIIKGLIIGIGKIIPGVSGSMLAISLGEYENMLSAVNNYFKDVINNLETEVRYLKNEIKKQIKITKEFDDRLAILEKEM